METHCKEAGQDTLSADKDGPRLLAVALAGAVLFHGGLLPFTHGNTYDAFIHMFFADSYHRSWFDPWEPRWYTGFATTSYPPGTHMAIAGLMHVIPLRAAFAIVQLTGILLLTVGVYRFSLLWVAARPAGYAALGVVLSSSVSETVHLFGQLPTIFSLGVFLNGLPYVYRWIVSGRIADLAAAIVFAAATTAAHHVTTIFGGVLFVLPTGLQALRAIVEIRAVRTPGQIAMALLSPLGRGGILAVLMLAAIVVTVFPYWSWSINDPITQVPIPHGSRESYIARPDLGLVFFLLPWGTTLFAVPYVAWKTATTRLWPLGLSVLLCFVLGTGSTTPVPRAILRGAFDILTLDRFTFWATILILPFLGYLIDGLLHGRSGQAIRYALGRGLRNFLIGGYFVATVAVAVFAAVLPVMQPTQPNFVDPAPIVRFLEQDEHSRWRYLTLGFGDQFAYLSAQTEALSVDGNYHSARRLPDLTRFSVERLENAKYLGVPGLGSLTQFLANADRYNLKYVFSNDEFYDPLLHFTGWTRHNRLENGIAIWERKDVTPLPAFPPRRDLPPLHMLFWGTLPPLALVFAGAVLVASAVRRNFRATPGDLRPLTARAEGFRHPGWVRFVVLSIGTGLTLGFFAAAVTIWTATKAQHAPEDAIAAYFDDLDFRRFEAAYARLDPVTRPDFETAMFNWRWRGGLIASYGKLTDLRATRTGINGGIADWHVELDWLTALEMRTETVKLRTVKRDGRWYIAPMGLRPVQTPLRIARSADVSWHVTGRRQPRAETDLHRDRLDRPRIAVHGARLVKRNGRYSVIGAVTNADGDPAMVSLFADLIAGDRILARHAAGSAAGHRLLPAETAGFRIDFEGVLSLDSEAARSSFDPTLLIPPELASQPTDAGVEARALVSTSDLYRGVSLNGVTVREVDGRPVLEALAVNTGHEVATIVQVVALLYDRDGRPVWTESGFTETNIYPGQSAPIQMMLPARSEIRVVGEVDPDKNVVNGSTQQADTGLPGFAHGTLALDIPGYGAMRLHVSTMTYDPLF